MRGNGDGRRFGAMLCEAIGLDPAKVGRITVTVAADDFVRFEAEGFIPDSSGLHPSVEFLKAAEANGLSVLIDVMSPPRSLRYSVGKDATLSGEGEQ